MGAIQASVRGYESWLRQQLRGEIVESDLEAKHDKMRKSPFVFLRATCWRWAETAHEICPELVEAPRLVAVGDAHVENFGLGRDAEGRLVWGVNDFDEAAETPYAFDLVRLSASALLAYPDAGLSAADASAAVLRGYRAGLKHPCPFILENDHLWLRELFAASDDERALFWTKLAKAPEVKPSKRFVAALEEALPTPKPMTVLSARRAGAGSLGRPRFVALATFAGGPLAREAKAIVPSCWAKNRLGGDHLRTGLGCHRSPDPWLHVVGKVIVRRLAPNSRKLDIDGNRRRLRRRVLESMGFELANIHAGSKARIADIKADIKQRGPEWLASATLRAAKATERDWRAYTAG
jgi:hypothetical protein